MRVFWRRLTTSLTFAAESQADEAETDLDMNLVRPGLYIGSQMAEKAPLEHLQHYNIQYVLQLGTSFFMKPSHPSLVYKCISANDANSVDLVKLLIKEKVIEFMEKGVQSGGLLVHCQMGMSRSATAVLMYLILKESLSFEDALVDLLEHRKVVQPNQGFCNQLKAVETCKGKLSKYKGASNFLPHMLAWYRMLDDARESAGLQKKARANEIVIKHLCGLGD